MRGVLSLAPLDFIDLLFYLQGFQIIELGLVRLELRVEFVFASFLLPTVNYSECVTKTLESLRGLGRDGPIRSFRRVLPVRPCHQLLDNCQYDRILRLK